MVTKSTPAYSPQRLIGSSGPMGGLFQDGRDHTANHTLHRQLEVEVLNLAFDDTHHIVRHTCGILRLRFDNISGMGSVSPVHSDGLVCVCARSDASRDANLPGA